MAGTPVTGSFTATGVSLHAQNASDGEFAYAITGTFVGKVYLERSVTPSRLAWEKVAGPFTTPCSMTYHSQDEDVFRLNCTSYTSGTISYTLTPSVVASYTPVTAAAAGLMINGGTVSPVLGGGLAVSNGSIVATGTVASVNLTSATGLAINGASALNIDASNNTCVGFGAGGGTLMTGGLSTYLGWQSGHSVTSGGENTFVGQITGQFVSTGGFLTLVGEHAGGYMTTESFNSAFGNDAMRNLASSLGANTAIGKSAMYAGGGSQNTALGFNALHGNATAVLLTGSVTAADSISLTFTGGFAGSPVTVTAPMTGLTTLAQAATALFAACTANTTINALIGGSIASSVIDASNIWFSWLGATSTSGGGGTATTGLSVVVTSSVSGTGTEVVTILGGNTGTGNLALGYQAMEGYYLTSGSNNFGAMNGSLYSLRSGSGNIAIGLNAGSALVSGSNDIFLGQGAGQLAATLSNDIGIGAGALANVVTGGNDIAIGSFAMGNYIGTGSGQQSVAIGGAALQGATGASFYGSTAVGYNAGKLISSANNVTLLGYNSGSKITTGSINTILGAQVASTTLTTGSGNIYVGVSSAIDATTAAESNTFRLGNHATNTIRVTGINTATPAFFLDWFPASTSYASDSAAATGGVAIGQIYRNGSAMQVRIS